MVEAAPAERQRTMDMLWRSALSLICSCGKVSSQTSPFPPRGRSSASPACDLVEGRHGMTGFSCWFCAARVDQALTASLPYFLPTIGPPRR